MKMPSFNDLDRDQLQVYQGAPPDGSVLVIGPPGTGKTIMAFHRAQMLCKLGQQPALIMYNTVLSAFVSSGHKMSSGFEVKTMHKWAHAWFRRLSGVVLPGEGYAIDWPKVHERAFEVATRGESSKVHWGHLIVDEGQDFPETMYWALALLIATVKWTGMAPALTVFADENQRLNEAENTTIAQMQSSMALTNGDRVFQLRRNYRNTQQIAEFAKHYYCGLQSGIPDTPERKGPLPVVRYLSAQSALANGIAGFVRANPVLEIGVICPTDKMRKRLMRELGEEFNGEPHVRLQSYGRQDKIHNDAGRLMFDTPVVTIVNRHSVKGLEFDAVFVVDPLLARSAAASGQQQFNMNMYVMCSRARTHLHLLFVSSQSDVRPHLPPLGLYKEM